MLSLKRCTPIQSAIALELILNLLFPMYVLANEKSSEPNSNKLWSVRFENFYLFNISKFNIPLIESGIQSIRSITQGYRDFDINQWPITIDPSIIEDSFLKTVCDKLYIKSYKRN